MPRAPRQASAGPVTAAAAATPLAPAPPGADGSPWSEHLRAEVARARLLARFSHAAHLSVPDVDGLLPLVAEGVSDLLGDACAIRLVSDDGRWIDLAALHGRDQGLMEAAAEVLASSRTRIDEGTDGQVVASGRTYFRPTVGASELREELKAESRPLLDLARVDSIITVPLVARGRVIGTMTAAGCTPGRPTPMPTAPSWRSWRTGPRWPSTTPGFTPAGWQPRSRCGRASNACDGPSVWSRLGPPSRRPWWSSGAGRCRASTSTS